MADRVYTLDELDALEAENEANVTTNHLFIAMAYMVRILEGTGIRYAVMGGMNMMMRGFEGRTTTDVDIAVEANARDLIGILQSHDRIRCPRIQSVAGSGVARTYVATGPAYGDDVPELAVEVDLILTGNRGAPIRLDSDHVVQINWYGTTYNLLNLREMFRAKLAAYHTREATKDYSDLSWMCQNFAAPIRSLSSNLDEDQREFFWKAYAAYGSEADNTELRSTLSLAVVTE